MSVSAGPFVVVGQTGGSFAYTQQDDTATYLNNTPGTICLQSIGEIGINFASTLFLNWSQTDNVTVQLRVGDTAPTDATIPTEIPRLVFRLGNLEYSTIPGPVPVTIEANRPACYAEVLWDNYLIVSTPFTPILNQFVPCQFRFERDLVTFAYNGVDIISYLWSGRFPDDVWIDGRPQIYVRSIANATVKTRTHDFITIKYIRGALQVADDLAANDITARGACIANNIAANRIESTGYSGATYFGSDSDDSPGQIYQAYNGDNTVVGVGSGVAIALQNGTNRAVRFAQFTNTGLENCAAIQVGRPTTSTLDSILVAYNTNASGTAKGVRIGGDLSVGGIASVDGGVITPTVTATATSVGDITWALTAANTSFGFSSGAGIRLGSGTDGKYQARFVQYNGTNGVVAENIAAIEITRPGSTSYDTPIAVYNTTGLSRGVRLTGTTEMAGILTVSGNVNLGGSTLNVAGTAFFGGTLTTSGNTSLGGTLAVTGGVAMSSPAVYTYSETGGYRFGLQSMNLGTVVNGTGTGIQFLSGPIGSPDRRDARFLQYTNPALEHLVMTQISRPNSTTFDEIHTVYSADAGGVDRGIRVNGNALLGGGEGSPFKLTVYGATDFRKSLSHNYTETGGYRWALESRNYGATANGTGTGIRFTSGGPGPSLRDARFFQYTSPSLEHQVLTQVSRPDAPTAIDIITEVYNGNSAGTSKGLRVNGDLTVSGTILGGLALDKVVNAPSFPARTTFELEDMVGLRTSDFFGYAVNASGQARLRCGLRDFGSPYTDPNYENILTVYHALGGWYNVQVTLHDRHTVPTNVIFTAQIQRVLDTSFQIKVTAAKAEIGTDHLKLTRPAEGTFLWSNVFVYLDITQNIYS